MVEHDRPKSCLTCEFNCTEYWMLASCSGKCEIHGVLLADRAIICEDYKVTDENVVVLDV